MEEPLTEYLTFRAGGRFAIQIASVVEIARLQPLVAVPNAPDFVCGVLNLRGRIIPVVDVRHRLKQAGYEYDAHSCIVVVSHEVDVVGFRVDSVDDVVRVPDSCVQPAPSLGVATLAEFVAGIATLDDGEVLVLDLPAVLYAGMTAPREA